MSDLIPKFEAFPKVPRLNRDMVITEKIDGTNAGIYITEDGDDLICASRSRWITPEKDNFGFARWAYDNVDCLMNLGPGMHWGEWWGLGIQRGYGLTEKRFSLFNTARWNGDNPPPACCGVVPVLYEGPFDTESVNWWKFDLRDYGSHAVKGWMKPEGVMAFHSASRSYFKVTCEDDEKRKGDKSV